MNRKYPDCVGPTTVAYPATMPLKSIALALISFALGACATQVGAAVAHSTFAAAVTKEGVSKAAPSGKASVEVLVKQPELFVGRLQLAADAQVPIHADADTEIIYVLQGAGTLTMEGTPHPVEPGSVIVMPAGSQVSYANGNEAFLGLQMFIPGGSAHKYASWELKAAEADPAGAAEAAPQ